MFPVETRLPGGSWKGFTFRYSGTANRGGTYLPSRSANAPGFRCAP